MTILVTGATGPYGRLVIDHLLDLGTPAGEIVAGVRDTAKAGAHADRGVRVARLDYDDVDSIAPALDGVDTVLLVSSPGEAVGRRIAQHQAVVRAAADSPTVSLLGYTSITKADTSPSPLAPEHLATEQLIAAEDLPAVILRNNWYTENEAPLLAAARETGLIGGVAGSGRIAFATRSEYAEAAARLLTAGDAGVYELGGDTASSFADVAGDLTRILGRPVEYVHRTPDEQAGLLREAGMDEGTIGFLLALDESYARGDLSYTDSTLSRVLGRPTLTLLEGLRTLA